VGHTWCMEMLLRFPLAQTIMLAEHALSTPDHLREKDGRKAPALWLVRADGIYLMSNGVPGLRSNQLGCNLVLYAIGWGPGVLDTDELSIIGGDDFMEHLELDTGMVAALRDELRDGRRWFAIKIRSDAYQLGVC
jgi:hypothetical protein